MDRISKSFQTQKPFIGYLTAGDGGLDYSFNCAKALVEGGVDILEIGLPFSDPVADGPVIQKAHQRAIEANIGPKEVLILAQRLREITDIPLILFSYFNPLLQIGNEYLHQLKKAGFDAILIVDLTLSPLSKDAESYYQKLEAAGLFPILLATPSTDNERLKVIGKMAKGFLYYVSQRGTTGVRTQLSNDFSEQFQRMKKVIHIPIVAGFGIADRAHAKAALEYADGFVVGSAFIKKTAEKVDPRELQKLAQEIDPRREVKDITHV